MFGAKSVIEIELSTKLKSKSDQNHNRNPNIKGKSQTQRTNTQTRNTHANAINIKYHYAKTNPRIKRNQPARARCRLHLSPISLLQIQTAILKSNHRNIFNYSIFFAQSDHTWSLQQRDICKTRWPKKRETEVYV